MMLDSNQINELKNQLKGKIFFDDITRTIYATDASIYFEKPVAVCIPENEQDIHFLIGFANKNKVALIPRAGGTSLAGQVVGSGIVVDISKHFTQIIEINTDQKWVKVQPGVILDELNRQIAKYNLLFGPEASTANRCTIGGMVGNNACGLHAVVYGTTRHHLLEVTGFLSNGSKATFKPLSSEEFKAKCSGTQLENKIYTHLNKVLSDKNNQHDIITNYPEPRLIRRNNGYALDQLLYSQPFGFSNEPFNMAKIVAGSEGTLMFITEIKLNLLDRPPKNKALICGHFPNIDASLQANKIALKYKVTAVELMDNIILEASKNNIEQQKNRFFIQGDPKAVLMIELASEDVSLLENEVDSLINELQNAQLGYHFPVLWNNDTNKAWNLRKAGLGIMANIPGDKKSVTVIEDTAVHPDVLPEYIAEFTQIMESYGEDCVYHAHAGTGEIHLRPRLNLKEEKDLEKFGKIAWDIAQLVKKYRGSLSGEHGDGRLRGEFIPFMLGNKVYQMLKELKQTWDPNGIFNPGKIIDTPSMKENLRYKKGTTRELETYFDFSDQQGIIRAIESCNGSGDCRKLNTAGGTMCPSYQASKNEKQSTRARANILREYLTNSTLNNPFNHKEIYEVLDLCFSCKACKSECPSSVDITKLKAEFLQHYYNSNGIPLRTRMVGNISRLYRLGSMAPGITNAFLQNKFTGQLLKKIVGFAPERSFPKIYRFNFKKYIKSLKSPDIGETRVNLFIDEFTRYNEPQLAKACIQLLTKLGYRVNVIEHIDSGRALLSKGMLIQARKIAEKNVKYLQSIINEASPLIGIEPSALLSFRDEYPELINNPLKTKAKELAQNCFLIEEFLSAQIKSGTIRKEQFTSNYKTIKLHGHCQQKSIASTQPVKELLSFPENYSVEEIASGCCGMAGSFGYEKEHFELSMKVGELVLFPEIRETPESTQITAPGTSCRHQILDGTGRKALHPAEIMLEALNE